MDREPNWDVITDLALKAVDDAKEAIGRTVLLAESAMDATLISMVTFAVLRGEHEAIQEEMADSPIIATAAKMAEDVATHIKGHKRAELKALLPLVREALRRAHERKKTVG